MASFVRRLCLVLPILLAPLPAASQQIPDADFDTKIANPAFVSRRPELLFDQGHHNTHSTRNRYDALAKLAKSDGFDVMVDLNPFTVKDLGTAAILLIANPLGTDTLQSPRASRSAFTEAECNAVHQWVAAGGSLLLIVEHAPMGTSARRLAARFGADFSTGYYVDPALEDASFGASTLIYSEATRTLGDHPILRGHDPSDRVKRVRTYTGQSIKGPPGSVNLLAGTATAQDLLLGPSGINGPIPDSLRRSGAGRAQGVAFIVGKGRVVMYGETTMFSAQVVPGASGEKRKVGMNAPGFDNRQLLINTLRWLAHALN